MNIENFFRSDDSAEATFCRIFTCVRQMYYLHRDAEAGIPVDYDTLKRYTDSIVYLAMKQEEDIKAMTEDEPTDRPPVETRGGALPIYEKIIEGLDRFYETQRKAAKERTKNNRKIYG